MVEFYRKLTAHTNVVISEIYQDLYMGNQQTSNIGGGRKEQAYLARFTLPNLPSYGSAQLERLDYNVYVNDITLASNSIQFPEFAIYKTKDASSLDVSEGAQDIDQTLNKDVLFFSSHIQGFSSITENFDGTKNAGSDAVRFIPIQRSMIREKQMFTTPKNLYENGNEKTYGVMNDQDYTEDQIEKNYAMKASEAGITSEDPDTLVCLPSGYWSGEGKERWGYNITAEWQATEGHSGWKTLYYTTQGNSGNTHDDKIWSGSRDTIPNTSLYGDELTPSNSIFEDVRGANEFFGEQTKGEEEVVLLATGAARLSTASKLTGGQAGELYTFWKDGEPKINYPARGTFVNSDGETKSGPSDRQEVMLLKKNIPFPIKHPAKPYRIGAAGSETGQDANDFANNIEMDINIKQLAPAWRMQETNTATEWFSLRRAFVVCFSEEPPRRGETFFEFAYRHQDKSKDDISTVHNQDHSDGAETLATTFDNNDLYNNTGTEISLMSHKFTQNYGVPLAIGIHTAGTGMDIVGGSGSTSATTQTDLYPARDDGWGSSGSGLTVTYQLADGGLTGTPSIIAAGTGYKVGDLVVVKNGNKDNIIEILSIQRKTKSFSAMAFLNTENGLMISNNSVMGGLTSHQGSDTADTKSAGVFPTHLGQFQDGAQSPIAVANRATTSPDYNGRFGQINRIGQVSSGWYFDETHKDVMIPKTDMFASSRLAESFIDQWVRLNFLVNAQSGDTYSSNQVNATCYAVATSTVSNTQSLGLAAMQGTVAVGDFVALTHEGDAFLGDDNFGDRDGGYDAYIIAVTAQDTDAKTATITLNKGITISINNAIAFFKPSTSGFGGRRDLNEYIGGTSDGEGGTISEYFNQSGEFSDIGDYSNTTNNLKTPRDGSWGRLLVSGVSDGQLVQKTLVEDEGAAGTDGTGVDQFFAMNSANGIQPSSSIDLWTKHMSIWLLNYKWDHSATNKQDLDLEEPQPTTSQVFIDKVEFKDFNYEIENASFTENNTTPESISISADTAFGARDADSDTSIATDKVDIYKTIAPTMWSIGVTDPVDFGWKHSDRGDDIDFASSWTTDENAWMMLHNYKCANLSSMEGIPNENIRASFTHSGGDTIRLAKWGECYNTHYGMMGSISALEGVLTINNHDEISANNPPYTNIGLTYLHTGFQANSNETSGNVVVIKPAPNDTAGAEQDKRQHTPVRVGDKIIFDWYNDDSNNTAKAVTNVEQVSGDEDNITITVDASTPFTATDNTGNAQCFIQPEGMCDNFTKKGLMFLNAYGSLNSISSVDHWAKRECGPASARIMEIVSTNSHGIDLQVDTLKPLLLNENEEYIVYLYGSNVAAGDFTITKTATAMSSVTDSTATNVKSGLTISNIDKKSRTFRIQWDGKANDGTTQLIKEGNLSALMISPWRYWLHMNIDNSKFDGTILSGAPTTPLPARTYDSFSMMNHNFVRWDGTSYKTAVLTESMSDGKNNTCKVDRQQDFKVGETFMIDDEALCCVAKSGDTGAGTITTLRGVSNTWSSTTDLDELDAGSRSGAAHLSGSKIKNVNVYTAWGEDMSGEDVKMSSSGAFGSLENRRNLGSTYKESIINHESSGGVPGAYINSWIPVALEEGSVLETDTDFGFGSFDNEQNIGGHLANKIIKTGKYNLFKLKNIKDSEDFQAGNEIDLLIRYKDDTVAHSTNINTRHSDTNKPFSLAVFNDTVPSTPKLSVAPYEADPFFPEFTWEATDGDLWYGLLHISPNPIYNQYHDKVAHIPLNEDATAYGAVYLENESGAKAAATGGTFNNSYEGLAGFAKDFDEDSGNFIKFDTFTDNITSEMSVVVHIIPDNYTGSSYILNQSIDNQTYSDWQIYMDSSRQIIAKLLPVGYITNPITLTSTPIIVDGETPTCVILTFDGDLKSGNCKLFINGKIEDQSGLLMVTPTINNWKNDTNLLDSSNSLFIGCSNTNATASFTFGDTEFDDDNDETITLIDVAGLSKTYKIKTDYGADATAQEFNAGANTTAAAANFKQIVESSNGHNGTITVAVSTGVVSMTQATVGLGGNTTITLSSGWNGICEADNRVGSAFTGGTGNYFDGKIEEIVIYNKCLYPIVPPDQKFIFTKPVSEISNESALSYSARLFVKDYHNIRGATAQEVAASSPISYRKSAFRLVD